MENFDVARIFGEIADILEIKGENQFRVRSYRRAALIVENLPEDVEAIVARGGLIDIPGIGKGLAEKIKEIIETGDCQLHRELMQEGVANLVELMYIPGLGPKKTGLLYQRLGVKTVADLEKAIKEGKIRNLEGMGEKTEENMIKGIQYYRQSQGRFRLTEALLYAQTIVDRLKKLPEVGRISMAGSLRRMQETIGDVDILVTSTDAEKIMNVFAAMKEVKDIVAKGKTKSSVILHSGLQVDIRVLEEESYGAALHYFTGSKEHNIAIRELGRKKGLKISEYGVFRVKNGRLVGGKNEEDIFQAVGLSYIPPELRENRGEIEAALSGGLPALIELKDISGDLHTHTKYSDGSNTVLEMVEEARKRKYEYIAITDHSRAVRVAGGLDTKRLKTQLAEIEKVNKKLTGFTVLAGTEVDILADGSLDFPDEVLERCDLVVGAVHSRFSMSRDQMTSRIVRALRNKHLNILAHPTGRLIKERPPYKVNMEEVIKAARDNKVALELNSFADRLDLNDIYCHAAKNAGALIAISTDSHNRMQLANITFGIATARRGWLEPENVINTYPLAKLYKFLRK